MLLVATCWSSVTITSATAAAQRADNGLEEQTVNSFELDPSRGVVRVTVDISLRNVTTDSTDGNVVRRAYFDSYAVAVPLGAENIVATRDGAILGGDVISDPDFPAFSTYRFPLGSPLFSGESATVQVTYDHFGAPPRDPVPWRVNEAYAGFVAVGFGDDGSVTVRVSQPFGYEFDESTDLTGFEASAPDEFGTVVYTRSGLDDGASVAVGLADDGRLTSRALEVADADIQLRAWPDDPDWADFAASTVEAGIPALQELLGSRWPIEDPVEVRETVEPNLRGYAGWFDRESNEIAVGEDLDADTIYHELSHAWFNGALSTERWFTEGLAQVYAAELVRRDGGDVRVPTAPPADAPGALALTEWESDLAVEIDRDTEEYGYRTSFWVVDVLVDEIGFDRTRDVLTALRNVRSPYDTGAPGERPDEDWKRVYDAIVEIGGALTARDVFEAQVIDAEGALLIDQRDQAAADVSDLAQRGAPWALPIGVRNRLERWEFADVDEALTVADGVLARRDELESIEAAVGIDEPDVGATAYAGAPMATNGGVDFTEVSAILDQRIDEGTQVLDRVERVDELEGAADVTPPDVADLDGVDDFATALDAADEQLLAVERIIEVDDRLDSTSGPLARIGAWGSDLDADIDDARSEVNAGDNAAALDMLDAADEQIGDLVATGVIRLAFVGVVAALLVGALELMRRRRRPRDDHASEAVPGTP
jgi:hypothetical protein